MSQKVPHNFGGTVMLILFLNCLPAQEKSLGNAIYSITNLLQYSGQGYEGKTE